VRRALAAAAFLAIFATLCHSAAARTGGASRAAAAGAEGAQDTISDELARVVASALAASDSTELEERFATWNAEADRARDVIRNNAASNAALQVMRDRLVALRAEAQALAEGQRARIEPLARELAAIGPPPEAAEAVEEPTLAALRARLNREIAEQNAVLAAAQVAAERFTVLLEDLSELIRDRLRLRVLTRGPTPLDPSVWLKAAADFATLGSDIRSEARAALASAASRELALERAPIAAVAFALSLTILVVGRLRVSRWIHRIAHDPKVSAERKIAAGVAATAARLGLVMGGVFLLFFAIVALGLFGLKVQVLIEGAGRGLIFVVVTYALATAYFAPDAPEMRLAGLNDRSARRARSASMILAWTAALMTAIVYSLDRLRFEREALDVFMLTLALVAAFGLLRLRRAYAEPSQPEARATAVEPLEEDAHEAETDSDETGALRRQMRWVFRQSLLALAVVAPTLSALGYRAAAYELLAPSLRSLGVLGVGALLYAFVSALSAGAAARAGDGEGRVWRLLPLFAAFALSLLAVPLLAMAWGASWSDVAYATRQIAAGVEVGGVTLSPAAFLSFALVFGIGYTLVGLVRRVLRTSVLPEMGMEAGARSAVESGVGFAGVTIAALLGITAAGLDLSNLAIVAGALSVGVGFGLQTIVNNFVSGLILLVERPIQVGDWIEVNGIHGTVKRVSVRSTEIETFDRSSYIVPNADLISSPVTNYTHRSALGRLTVTVGVAYSSDPRQVESILREVAEAHPMVLRRPPPAILFRAFGADALEFEIRAFLRDINYIMIVGSDLHFAVAEKFRAAGIEIPFGQRDIWFRNADALAAALRPVAPPQDRPEPPREAPRPQEATA
jgi:small-conductance mechanosensitive channel